MPIIRRKRAPTVRVWSSVGVLAAAVLLYCSCGSAFAARHPHAQRAPSRATVLEVQHLFVQLGYPLGNKPLGGLGVRTRGALSYFQHKYRLKVTGYPDVATIAKMQAVVAELRGPISSKEPQPHDLVERALGKNPPVLPLAIVLAVIIAILALSTRNRRTQDSATAEGTIPAASGDT